MAQDLLRELHRLGIKLRLVDGRLDVLAPAGSLTPRLRTELTSHRDALIALLRRNDSTDDDVTITPRPQDRHEPFPLTDIQHAYWVGRNSAMELGGVSTHYYCEFERDGLDVDRLGESLRKVIDRHDMLRTRFLPDGRQQVLATVPAYDIAVNDLRGLDPAAREDELSRVRAEMAHQVLPSDRWPLFDIRASLLGDGLVRLHVSQDMLIMDAVGVYQFFHDWRRFYEDPDWSPAPLEFSYRDFVLAEESARSGERYRRAEAYWMERLEHLPPPPALPLANQPGQLSQTRFTRRRGRMPQAQWKALKLAARNRGLTPSAVLMTAFAEVVRRWSRQPGFTLNLTLFKRPPAHPEIDQIIGDFTSLTMIAVETDPGEAFARRAEALQRQLMQNLEHDSFSGVRVLRERARRLGGGPAAAMPIVFTSGLVLGGDDDTVDDSMRFFGDDVYSISQTPQVWLDHQVMTDRGDLVYNWDSVEELFPPGLLDDMLDAYDHLLAELAAGGDVWDRSGSCVALPDWQVAERTAANRTAAEIPARTLYDLVEEQALRQPDAVAVIAGGLEFSYAETLGHARRLARRLVALGTRRDELVAVVMDKGMEQVAAVLGVAAAGAAYLPVDPQWPAARRHDLLAQGRVRTVVTSAVLRTRLDWPDDVRTVTFIDAEVSQASPAAPATRPAPEDLAYVIFTSGSTGRPKGVMIDHRSAANTVQDINARFRIGPADRVLALSALSFDLSVYDVFGILAAGGAVVLPDQDRVHDPAHWTELVERHGVTVWNSVPALMQAWTDARQADRTARPAGPRLVLLSGDWIPVALPAAIRSLHPDADVISLGGATEASIWSVHHPIGEVPAHWTRIPYGKPLANQTMHVYDDRLDPCPVWTTGEIYIGGAGVAKGYWADPERTGERFVTHPRTGERLYRTGDLGRYLPGGDIDFLGREDFQVKLNGYRIELGEIAAAVRRQPGVGEAVVTLDPNPVTGRRQLVAYAVPARTGGGGVDESARWRTMVETGEAELQTGVSDLSEDLATYRRAWAATEELSAPLMARTLARLGQFTEAGYTTTAERIVEDCGLKQRYAGLLGHWMAALAEQGVLRRTDRPDAYRCDRPLDEGLLDEQVQSGMAGLDRARQGLLNQDPRGTYHRVAQYFNSCAENQVELLRGDVNLLQFLMPDGKMDLADSLYSENALSLIENRVVARVVRSYVDQLPERPGKVRILEVGAGVGATSAHVLPELPAERVSYRYTDVSTYFTERAKSRYGVYPFVEFATYDIDRDPQSQGVAPGSMDVIIAAQVLHNARELGPALQDLRSALAPGGLLIFIEGTVNWLAHMVTVGFIQDFSNYRDEREMPLLSVAEWQKALESAGFTGFSAIPGADEARDLMDQNVLIVQAPHDRAAVDPAALQAGVADLLPEYMVPRHYVVIDRLPLNANGKVDLSSLPAPWVATAAGEAVRPRTDLERRLFGIWSEALERDDFGVEDNFFELGGDSLHAVRILGRLQEELGIEQTAEQGLQRLFDNPTIAGLARSLRSDTDLR